MRSAEHLDPEKLKQALAIADKAIRDAEKKEKLSDLTGHRTAGRGPAPISV